MKRQNKTKIGEGSVVKKKIGGLENITREVGIKRVRKEVVGFFYSLVGKKNFLVQFGDVHNKETSYSSLVFLSLK